MKTPLLKRIDRWLSPEARIMSGKPVPNHILLHWSDRAEARRLIEAGQGDHPIMRLPIKYFGQPPADAATTDPADDLVIDIAEPPYTYECAS